MNWFAKTEATHTVFGKTHQRRQKTSTVVPPPRRVVRSPGTNTPSHPQGKACTRPVVRIDHEKVSAVEVAKFARPQEDVESPVLPGVYRYLYHQGGAGVVVGLQLLR